MLFVLVLLLLIAAVCAVYITLLVLVLVLLVLLAVESFFPAFDTVTAMSHYGDGIQCTRCSWYCTIYQLYVVYCTILCYLLKRRPAIFYCISLGSVV